MSLSPPELCHQANDLDVAEVKRSFDKNGVAVVEGFLDPDQSAALSQEVHGHFAALDGGADRYRASRSDPFARFECEVMHWDPLWESNQTFAGMSADPRLDAATRACLPRGYRHAECLVMWSVRGGRGQAWHQDCQVGSRPHYNLNRLLYPTDVDPEDGAIVVVPGSHRRGAIPPGGAQDSLPGEIVLTPSAGTLILLHGWVYHRVTPNTSGRPRVSVNFRVYPSACLRDPCHVGVYRNGMADFANWMVVEAHTG